MTVITLAPSLYVKCNQMHRSVVEDWLKKRAEIFKWNSDGTDSILDIGCGTGDVTFDYLLPIMPKNSKFLIGADLSKDMLEYAKDKYEGGFLKFCQFDLQQDQTDLEDFKNEKFKYVTSFFTINLVQNQKLALQHIYNFLKPNGTTLVSITLDFTIYKVLYDPFFRGKYKSYMHDLEGWDFRKKNGEKPLEKFEGFLEEIGFRDFKCEVQEVVNFHSVDSMIAFVSLFPFTGRMSDEVKIEFLKDFVEGMESLNISSVDQETGERGFLTPTKIMLIEAYKY